MRPAVRPPTDVLTASGASTEVTHGAPAALSHTTTVMLSSDAPLAVGRSHDTSNDDPDAAADTSILLTASGTLASVLTVCLGLLKILGPALLTALSCMLYSVSGRKLMIVAEQLLVHGDDCSMVWYSVVSLPLELVDFSSKR